MANFLKQNIAVEFENFFQHNSITGLWNQYR